MIDKTFAQRWVDALRSGDYEQGRGSLRFIPSPGESPRYCCLGVACDLVVQDGNATWLGDTGNTQVEFQNPNGGTDTSGAVVPRSLEVFLGVQPEFADGSFGIEDRDGCPVNWNDSKDMDFNQIADKIENLVLSGV